jgi:hypothetical protein
MRLDRHDNEVIEITLSKRNLETLLEKLNWDSKRTLCIDTPEGITLQVKAEPNEIHYATREPGPILDHLGNVW